jgi:hypothetical protein
LAAGTKKRLAGPSKRQSSWNLMGVDCAKAGRLKDAIDSASKAALAVLRQWRLLKKGMAVCSVAGMNDEDVTMQILRQGRGSSYLIYPSDPRVRAFDQVDRSLLRLAGMSLWVCNTRSIA